MKPWVYVAAVFLPGGCLLLLASWIRRRLRDVEDLMLAGKIVPPVVKFAGHDDALRVRTIARRKAADAIRSRSNRVASGERLGSLLKVAGRND